MKKILYFNFIIALLIILSLSTAFVQNEMIQTSETEIQYYEELIGEYYYSTVNRLKTFDDSHLEASDILVSHFTLRSKEISTLEASKMVRTYSYLTTFLLIPIFLYGTIKYKKYLPFDSIEDAETHFRNIKKTKVTVKLDKNTD